ncbi:hypothetical protein [Neobacillus kokaensis]|uniref:Uncharacterized protein n=1 Tax=Neobacillus kokaensis TaxID=2759023 RepID=A0ABQ3NAJ2_9BACI|nr:hypothetical protein [Neobacillus kokaensis]GHH99491.1 hypothetical protein AM1BK_30340 [Neobacillus kokaensis]
MDNLSNAKLTSAEIAALWTQYMNELARLNGKAEIVAAEPCNPLVI